MKKGFLLGAVAVAAASLAAPSHAATIVLTTGSGGTYTGSFDTSSIVGWNPVPAGTFSHTWTFSLPTSGYTSGTISSVALVPANDITFTSVTLNGVAYNVSATGVVEFQNIVGLPTVPGVQTLVVNGSSGGNGQYAGTIEFNPTTAVPEPATWAMMIAGFGMVGAGMRRRTTKVAFA